MRAKILPARTVFLASIGAWVYNGRKEQLWREMMGRELEWKYATDAQTQDAIMHALSREWETVQMETTYFDTPARDLSARKWTLRHRSENGAHVCTLKTPGENGARGEWETQCAEITDAILVLCKLGAPQELATLARAGLHATCSARFTRTLTTLRTDESTIELALDCGMLCGGDCAEALCEVEIEHKHGDEAASARLAATIATQFHLSPEEKSKFQRANALANARVPHFKSNRRKKNGKL